MPNNTQMLHSMNTKLASLDTRMCAIEKQNLTILAKVGESHAFIQPKADVKGEAGKGSEAKPLTLKQLYHKGKASLKRRGLTQAMYQHMVKALKGQKLQGDEYKQAYIDCYNANGYGSL